MQPKTVQTDGRKPSSTTTSDSKDVPQVLVTDERTRRHSSAFALNHSRRWIVDTCLDATDRCHPPWPDLLKAHHSERFELQIGQQVVASVGKLAWCELFDRLTEVAGCKVMALRPATRGEPGRSWKQPLSVPFDALMVIGP